MPLSINRYGKSNESNLDPGDTGVLKSFKDNAADLQLDREVSPVINIWLLQMLGD